MAQRFAWQALAKFLTEHRATYGNMFLDEAVVVKDLRDPWLLLGVGEQQLTPPAPAPLTR